jgi:cytochrome P450
VLLADVTNLRGKVSALGKLLAGGDDVHGDFQAHLEAARTEGEVHIIGDALWAISYPACEWMMQSDGVESAGTYVAFFGGEVGSLLKLQENWLETSCGSRHERRRAIANRAFRDKALTSYLLRRIPEIVNKGFDRLGVRFQGDFVSAYAKRVGRQLLLEWLGVPAAMQDAFTEAVHKVGLTVGAPVDEQSPTVVSAREALDEIFPMLLNSWRQNNPPVGLLATLRAANTNAADPISDLEAVSCFLNFAFDAELLEPQISNAVMELLTEAAPQSAAIETDKADLLVSEIVRLATPSPLLLRRASRDCIYRDTAIAGGQWIVLYMAAALRDPYRFARAGTADLSRGTTALSFGLGNHTCLGGRMAFQVVKAVLATVWTRYDARLDGAIEWTSGPYRGVQRLPISMKARQ